LCTQPVEKTFPGCRANAVRVQGYYSKQRLRPLFL
jgi:hypothetical protein